MKLVALILLNVCALGLLAQAKPTSRSTASGECSVAHSGNYDTITIENCGIGKEQGERIIALLQQLANSTDMNAKLDQLLAIVGTPVKFTVVSSGPVAGPTGSNPRAAVTFYTDGPDDRGQFEILCSRACTPVEACALQGANTTKLATVAGIPELAEFLFLRQFPPLTQCTLTVESRDSSPVGLVSIATSKRLDGLIPNAIQPPNFVNANGTRMQ